MITQPTEDALHHSHVLNIRGRSYRLRDIDQRVNALVRALAQGHAHFVLRPKVPVRGTAGFGHP